MFGLYSLIIGCLYAVVLGMAPPGKPQGFASLALMVYLCLLTFKVLLDDAVHFQDAKKNQKNWTHGLILSIIWNLLMLGAIHAAVVDGKRALMYTTLALLFATVWLVRNYVHAPEAVDAAEFKRHRGWAYINVTNIAVLVVLITYLDSAPPIFAGGALVLLVILTLFDMVYFQTFQRVTDVFKVMIASESAR